MIAPVVLFDIVHQSQSINIHGDVRALAVSLKLAIFNERAVVGKGVTGHQGIRLGVPHPLFDRDRVLTFFVLPLHGNLDPICSCFNGRFSGFLLQLRRRLFHRRHEVADMRLIVTEQHNDVQIEADD